MKQIEWTELALEDLAALDRGTARRITRAVERFAQNGVGNVKRLQGIKPPEFRWRTTRINGAGQARSLQVFRFKPSRIHVEAAERDCFAVSAKVVQLPAGAI